MDDRPATENTPAVITNRVLERYYESKYAQGGYAEHGRVVFGFNVSKRYHQAKYDAAVRLLDATAGETILDAGCGDGALSARIAAQCGTVHAVDIAGNAFASEHARPNVHFEKMNIEALRFGNSSFDKIVCVEALEHVLDPQKTLAECHRVLRPGGRLVMTYPTINRSLIKRALHALRLKREVRMREHLTEWSYDEIVKNVSAAGFEVLEAEGVAFDISLFSWVNLTTRFIAEKAVALSLAIRRFPRNSVFVVLSLRKPADPATVRRSPGAA